MLNLLRKTRCFNDTLSEKFCKSLRKIRPILKQMHLLEGCEALRLRVGCLQSR
jgi:hypothetical protein